MPRPSRLDRRQWLALVGATLTSLSCRRERGSIPEAARRSIPAASAEPSVVHALDEPRGGIEVIDLALDHPTFPARAVVIVPRPPPAAKLPLLVALHGMGETTDPVTGANGWLRAYELDAALDALHHPPLDDDDFRGLVTADQLTGLNAALVARPYEGLIVACPYLPKEIGGAVSFDDYARFLGDVLLPRVRAVAPALADPRSTGIDGVSLGGVTALTIGALRPDLFGAVGALQPAIYGLESVERIAADLARSIGKRPLRLTTSEGDVYRDAIVALDQKLVERKVAHDFSIYPGPHDYIWNKGPGALEMLLWHDRTLRRAG